MTIQKQIEDIKNRAACAIHGMKNHKEIHLPDNDGFNEVIIMMHNASSKEQLAEAYYMYINLCIGCGYGDGSIIAGIMQNKNVNEKFGVNIDSVVKSLINIRSNSVNLGTVIMDENPVKKESAKEKDPLDGLSEKDIIRYASYYDPNEKAANEFGSTEMDILKGDLLGMRAKRRKAAYEWVKKNIDINKVLKKNIQEVNNIKNDSKQEKIKSELVHDETQMNAKTVESNQTKTVQQTVAAHSETGGFNINNFIKSEQRPKPVVNTVASKMPIQQQPVNSVFLHQICGLEPTQILEEILKHFKFLPETTVINAFYDLYNNKYLAKKMKEFNSKQRPNNPYLTQVNINEYIDEPSLLARYSYAFTMPSNDKGYVIVVLFNPIPETLNNGTVQYPLHIFKAKLKKDDNK